MLYLGRIDRERSNRFIIVLDNITKKYKDWTLVIAGGLIQEDHMLFIKITNTVTSCKNLILFNDDFEMKNSPNVLFTGSVYGKQKKDLFIKSSVFINPSNFENYGQSIAEAFLIYTVVISKNTPWYKVVEKIADGFYVINKNLKKL